MKRGVVGNVERKIGRVVKNVQRRLGQVLRRGRQKRSIKAGMGPPYGGGNIQKWLERIIVGGAGLRRNFQERKIGRVVKNVQRIRSMKAGMGPPYGSLETSKKGWNRSSSGGERVVFGNFPRKRSKKSETSRNGSTESFNEGWNGSLDWVVKNVQKLLEQAIDDVQERLTRRGFVGTNNLSLETGRRKLLVDEEGNPPSETIKEGWNGSLEQVLVVNV